jgi:glycosyltransferase involved in cell wall biosynthesis
MASESSIIMATYNRSQYILNLKSIQAQTFENWECIIIDDGGTDNTQEILAPILKQDLDFSILCEPKYQKRVVRKPELRFRPAQGDYIF